MSIVTIYLEMHSPDQLRPKRCTDGRFEIREKIGRDWRFNRDLYLAVGQMWSWNDKRRWSDEQWKEYGLSPELRTFAAHYDGSLAGYYELRGDDEDGIEIAYFGLLPEFIGRGLGGALLTSAIEDAWRTPSVSRVWVHTCTLDHPSALGNYQARGMVIYKQETAES
jgi:GNAT superfamily N-acetyltransferase